MPEVDPRMFERPANDSQTWGMRDRPGKSSASGIVWLVLAAVVIAIGLGSAVWLYRGDVISDFTKPRVKLETLSAGSGAFPTKDDVVLINYKGTLPDGKVFDQARNSAFPLDGVISGFAEAMYQMQRGGKYKVFIPSELGYGAAGAGPVPPNTDLTMEVELLDFRNRVEIEREMKAMQEQQANGDSEAKKSPAPDNAGATQ